MLLCNELGEIVITLRAKFVEVLNEGEILFEQKHSLALQMLWQTAVNNMKRATNIHQKVKTAEKLSGFNGFATLSTGTRLYRIVIPLLYVQLVLFLEKSKGSQLCVCACCVVVCCLCQPMSAQGLFHRADSMLSVNYLKGNIDTAYIVRPKTKWTLKARLNVSGATIKTEGMVDGQHFNAKMQANRKGTISLGVSYLGFSLSAALNPAKLMGKYHDYELNFNSYGRRFGFDIIYQDAKNFMGWHDHEGRERITLPDGLQVKTLNLNAFYVLNSRRFSYPAVFSQSYIQRRSAGSFLLAVSGQGQKAKFDGERAMELKVTNVGLGAGYGYNFVPKQGWLLHLSALPTFIVYSKTSMTFDDIRVPLSYHFPEVIITGRGAALYQWRNKFIGMSMVFNFTNIGHKENLAIHNIKWRIRTFFGLRL